MATQEAYQVGNMERSAKPFEAFFVAVDEGLF
jgi:hypothetical protein